MAFVQMAARGRGAGTGAAPDAPGSCPGQQEAQNRAERINVGALIEICHVAAGLLGSHVAGRAQDGAMGGLRFVHFRR